MYNIIKLANNQVIWTGTSIQQAEDELCICNAKFGECTCIIIDSFENELFNKIIKLFEKEKVEWSSNGSTIFIDSPEGDSYSIKIGKENQ